MKNNDQITDILKPVIEAMGFELIGIETLIQQANATLRIYIDCENGITADECGEVNKQARSILSVEGFPIENWMLEVSSPGINRRLFTLEQCQQFVGEIAEIKLKEKLKERRNFKGEILNSKDTACDAQRCLALQVDNQQIFIPFEMVDKINLVRI